MIIYEHLRIFLFIKDSFNPAPFRPLPIRIYNRKLCRSLSKCGFKDNDSYGNRNASELFLIMPSNIKPSRTKVAAKTANQQANLANFLPCAD
jgi:hypothetical protein